MFEILMLIAFLYVGFCHLLPTPKPPARSTRPETEPEQPTTLALQRNGNALKSHAPCLRQGSTHFSQSHRPHQRKLCKALRLC